MRRTWACYILWPTRLLDAVAASYWCVDCRLCVHNMLRQEEEEDEEEEEEEDDIEPTLENSDAITLIRRRHFIIVASRIEKEARGGRRRLFWTIFHLTWSNTRPSKRWPFDLFHLRLSNWCWAATIDEAKLNFNFAPIRVFNFFFFALFVLYCIAILVFDCQNGKWGSILFLIRFIVELSTVRSNQWQSPWLLPTSTHTAAESAMKHPLDIQRVNVKKWKNLIATTWLWRQSEKNIEKKEEEEGKKESGMLRYRLMAPPGA